MERLISSREVRKDCSVPFSLGIACRDQVWLLSRSRVSPAVVLSHWELDQPLVVIRISIGYYTMKKCGICAYVVCGFPRGEAE